MYRAGILKYFLLCIWYVFYICISEVPSFLNLMEQCAQQMPTRGRLRTVFSLGAFSDLVSLLQPKRVCMASGHSRQSKMEERFTVWNEIKGEERREGLVLPIPCFPSGSCVTFSSFSSRVCKARLCAFESKDFRFLGNVQAKQNVQEYSHSTYPTARGMCRSTDRKHLPKSRDPLGTVNPLTEPKAIQSQAHRILWRRLLSS